MGTDIKSLRVRIKSVSSTMHLTKAMGLVASSKIKRAGINMAKSREYFRSFENVISMLTSCAECKKSPYMQKREGNRTKLLVIAGDRGLAGGYNANIFRLLREYPDAEKIPVGFRACARFGQENVSSEHFSYAEASEIAKTVCAEFAEGKFDRFGIVSTKYISIMTQEAYVKWIFPLEKKEGVKTTGAVFEPDELTILNSAIPDYVASAIVAAVRESFSSEVAARRMAMDSAGKNAQNIIDDLQLKYNKARQGAITQEITEIVAGTGN